MRTATIIAERHDGSEVLVSGPKTPIVEQLAAFRKLMGQPTHPEFASVQYQDSDGPSRTIRFGRPQTAPEKPKVQKQKESKTHESHE